MRVSGQLEEVSLEQLATDPTNLPEGRFWGNSTSKDFKVVLNGIVRKLLTEVSVLTTANIGDNQVTANKIADSNVTTPKIADGSVTNVKRAALGQQVSSGVSPSIWETTSGTPVDVTNLSVSITTSGRPVWVGLVWDSASASDAFVQADNSSTPSAIVSFLILRGSTEIARHGVGSQPGGSTSTLSRVPAGSVFGIDTPSAGTYTYKLQAFVGLGKARVANCKLMAFEL